MEAKKRVVRERVSQDKWVVLDEKSAARVVEVLEAAGKLYDLDWEDMDEDHLREVVGKSVAAERMRNPDFCETRDRLGGVETW